MSRYYDPSVGQFISPDTQDYLAPDTIGGVDLYAYCNNNPVMGYDPTGHWDWGQFWKGVAVVAVAAVVVVAVAAVTAATGGSAVLVFIGAGLSALTSAGTSILVQGTTTGTVDLAQVFVDAAVGAVMGAFGGSNIGIIGSTIAGGVTNFAGSVASDIVAGEDISWGAAIASGISGAAFGFLSGGGAQQDNATLKLKMHQKKQRIAAGRPTKSIDAQIFNEKTLLKNRAIKEVMLGLDDLYTFALEYPIAATLSLIPW